MPVVVQLLDSSGEQPCPADCQSGPSSRCRLFAYLLTHCAAPSVVCTGLLSVCAVCWAPGPDNMTARTTDKGTSSGAMLTQLSVLDYRPVRIESGVIVNSYQRCLIGRPRPVVVRLLTVISVGLSAHQDRQWCDVNTGYQCSYIGRPRPVLL